MTGPVWPTAADVRPSPVPVRARWPRGSGRHRLRESVPTPDEMPTVPLFLFTHPHLLAGTETIPGGTL